MRKFVVFSVMMPFFLLSSNVVAQQLDSDLIINEFMSSNSSTITDEDGDFSDWIELYNPTPHPVEMEGWGLSDNLSKPFKWIFPKVTILPGEYLLVWASGKNRSADRPVLREGILRQVYSDIPGLRISDLTNHISFPQDPSYTEIITDLFEAPIDVDDDYGQRMHGLLRVPATGYYTFWLASDDNGELYLSTDDNPLNVQLIAEVPDWTNSREWDKYPEQQSEEILLVEGQYYYISALMKEAGGLDNLSVGWKSADGVIERPMPASHIVIVPPELHTNFSISSGGEPLVLTNPSGITVHALPEVKLTADISYGLMEEIGEFLFFDTPTPGNKNSSSGYDEIIDSEVNFSHQSGFYSHDFELLLSSNYSDATIYYTLDGSEPSSTNLGGTTYTYKNNYESDTYLTREMRSHLYSEPISVVDRSPYPYQLGGINAEYSSLATPPFENYFKGTVVRAKVVKEGALSPYSTSHTYFVSPLGNSTYDLPVVSIITDESGLFDYFNGIYVAGKIADDWVKSYPNEQWHGLRPANYNQRGREWERPAYFEYFGQDGALLYNHRIGLRVHGGWSRSFNRKSLRMYARSSYGTSDYFEHPFFENLTAKGNPNVEIKEFRRLLIRNSGNDFSTTLYRDALMHDLVKHLSFSTMASQPVIHFINGEYWGIMNLRERYDEYFLESHFGVSGEDVAVLDALGNLEEGLLEDRSYFFDIVRYAESNSPAISTHYEWVKQRVNTESLAQYYAAQIYFYNTDWPGNNMKFWRNRKGEYSPNAPLDSDGRWNWMLYDTDFGMGLYGEDYAKNGLSLVVGEDARDPSSRLFKSLLQNETFKNYFVNSVADQLNSCFSADYITKKVDLLNANLSSSRAAHYNRWRSGIDEGEVIKTFGNNRSEHVRAHTQAQFGLSDNVTLQLNRKGEGFVEVNSLLIDENLPGVPYPEVPYPWEGVYFKDTPIRLKAIDYGDYQFSHWEGVAEDLVQENEIEISLADNSAITAVFSLVTTHLIHYWHFNNIEEGELSVVEADESLLEVPGNLRYSGSGAGYMDRVSDGTSINARSDIDAGTALRVRNPSHDRYLDVQIPTTNFKAIKISFAVTRTSKGSENQALYYRASENSSWALFSENFVVTEDYQVVNLDFSHLKEVDNNSEFAIRIAFTGEAASGSSGNNRFDNITVEGNSISTNIVSSDFVAKIFPNPATDIVNIISSDKLIGVKVLDINGRNLLSKSAEDYTHTIDVANFSAGLYLVSVTTERGTKHFKLVVK